MIQLLVSAGLFLVLTTLSASPAIPASLFLLWFALATRLPRRP